MSAPPSLSALVKQVGDIINTTVSPVLAALMATAQENQLATQDQAAAMARLEAKIGAIADRLAALEGTGAPKRAINVGTVDVTGAIAATAPRAKKDPEAFPSNNMNLFIRDFSVDPAVRAEYATSIDLAKVAAKVATDVELDEAGWKKVARVIWRNVPAATKELWRAKHAAESKAAPPAELTLDEGDAFAAVTLDA